MKIVEKGVMPDGTEIQLEDWRESNTDEYPDLYGFEIGAYPMAQRTSKGGWIQGGRRFRLGISYNAYAGYSNKQVKADYKMLKSGEKNTPRYLGTFLESQERYVVPWHGCRVPILKEEKYV